MPQESNLPTPEEMIQEQQARIQKENEAQKKVLGDLQKRLLKPLEKTPSELQQTDLLNGVQERIRQLSAAAGIDPHDAARQIIDEAGPAKAFLIDFLGMWSGQGGFYERLFNQQLLKQQTAKAQQDALLKQQRELQQGIAKQATDRQRLDEQRAVTAGNLSQRLIQEAPEEDSMALAEKRAIDLISKGEVDAGMDLLDAVKGRRKGPGQRKDELEDFKVKENYRAALRLKTHPRNPKQSDGKPYSLKVETKNGLFDQTYSPEGELIQSSMIGGPKIGEELRRNITSMKNFSDTINQVVSVMDEGATAASAKRLLTQTANPIIQRAFNDVPETELSSYLNLANRMLIAAYSGAATTDAEGKEYRTILMGPSMSDASDYKQFLRRLQTWINVQNFFAENGIDRETIGFSTDPSIFEKVLGDGSQAITGYSLAREYAKVKNLDLIPTYAKGLDPITGQQVTTRNLIGYQLIPR